MKENVQLIFFYIADCVAPSRNISMFFKERAAASEKTTASEIYLKEKMYFRRISILRENVQLLLKIMST